ncbi:hypothetical protein GCM10010497_34900 [Streptomyces cinereoruber]|uniref:Secreted protein n=1 Tax=Streptomyces cinereoruber TaxID=67260 RepID=A0AAV4KIU0_9ACTN|nr:hypothetical protein [Streptomyces cinereoruber]MBB4159309.1 hypothetical protein [Streptomyces cinereoruber]MBY8817534.1 hypothetical protein [Streptomyces cinereoruber]NIH64231.1 hypothetical protein [Streptomyces cinereoruber]QEV31978.1 hypothetical protein CP977_07215 [Streptomyces cinereoruber]GGR29533.1 hypothetical protein GCM10010497_34900 [Streptomyces cinereoruber]
MQLPAAPDLTDLAHTHAGPMHWLATATATAAVVALAGLLQPGPVGTTTATAAAAPRPAAAPEAAGVAYPVECGGGPRTVAKRASGDLDGDGNPETVAVVHCEAGSGTPPSGVYVLTRGKGADAPARVVATLVAPDQHRSVTELAVRDGAVLATLLGYSSFDVPRCCPDEKEQVSWRWRGGAFVRAGQDEARGA